jgi:hypothetical protein
MRPANVIGAERTQEEQHLEKDKEINSLHDIVNNLEVRLEHQEQYSRRTSLRFHNIDVPVDALSRFLMSSWFLMSVRLLFSLRFA